LDLGQFDKPAAFQAGESEVYSAPLRTYDAVREKRAELEKTGRFTQAGIADELRKFATIAKPTLDRAKEQLGEAKRDFAERRSKISPTISEAAPDQIGEMRKMEARAVMRTMSRRDLLNVLAGPTPDPTYVEAALEARPHELPNIGGALRRQLEADVLQAKFGSQIEELDEIDRAIETAEHALNVAQENIDSQLKGQNVAPERRAPALFKTAG